MTFKSHSSNSSNSSTTTTASRVFPACKATALACTGLHAGPVLLPVACKLAPQTFFLSPTETTTTAGRHHHQRLSGSCIGMGRPVLHGARDGQLPSKGGLSPYVTQERMDTTAATAAAAARAAGSSVDTQHVRRAKMCKAGCRSNRDTTP